MKFSPGQKKILQGIKKILPDYLKTNMMSHRKDFENHNFSFKIHCKPIYSVCSTCSRPEGIIHYSKSTEPPKIQEIAFKNAGFCWIPCLPEMSHAAVPWPHRIS